MKMISCPSAAKPFGASPESGLSYGGTYRAWRMDKYLALPLWGGYGMNSSVMRTEVQFESGYQANPRLWVTANVSKANTIPVYLDGAWHYGAIYQAKDAPPQFDLVPTMLPSLPRIPYCMDGHQGHVNGLFMDWSVRKVGLKELWTLKWDRQYDTAGPWTKAGGARPDDWPEWMRKFRDY